MNDDVDNITGMNQNYNDEETTVLYEYYFDYGDEYMYPGYKFERPVYLYLWEILVTLTFLQNLLILSVFLQRKMRNPINVMLSAIAISDSLTGLVTLPTYIMVFQRFDPYIYNSDYVYDYEDMYHDTGDNNTVIYHQTNSSTGSTTTSQNEYIFSPPTKPSSNETLNSSLKFTTIFYDSSTIPPIDGYTLTKDLCRSFMISKYFLSKSFHTISIFLTLFLEIQKYVSMAYPYRYETCFNRYKVVIIYCICAFIFCPLLHSFHLVREKAEGGLCQWEYTGTGCGKDCIYLWIAFIVRHLIPCVTLVIFTILFIKQLRKGEKHFRRVDSSSSQYSRRVSENRRISFVVTTIVVVRLIPEIPFSIFLLFNSIDGTWNHGNKINLETNRIFHMCYEICLVCSFLANFYIYLIFNGSFRRRMYRTYIQPIRKHISNSFSVNEFSSVGPRKTKVQKSRSVTAGMSVEMKSLHSDISEKMIKVVQ